MSVERILSAHQIRAARALLNWSQRDLAGLTQLSIATIRKIELCHISPRNSTARVICQALEEAGIEFIEADGVKRRLEEIRVFDGIWVARDFFADVMASIKGKNPDMVLVADSIEALRYISGGEDFPQFESLLKKDADISIKCLLADAGDLQISTPRLEFRTISKQYVDVVPFCVYGDKYALFQMDNEVCSKIVIMRSRSIAHAFRRQFSSLWDKATSAHVEIAARRSKAS